MENYYQIGFVLLSSAGGAALIIAALSSWLGKVWANRILESDRAKYAKELDNIRHQFEIERNQLSIIHENQKNSFQRVITSLYKSIKILEQEYDEEWYPVSGKHYEELKQVIIEESLFLGNEGERALNIYLSLFNRAVSFPDFDYQGDVFLRRIHGYLIYTSEVIREFFRKRIGLSDNHNPLIDIFLLDVSIMLNEINQRDLDLKTPKVAGFDFKISPQDMIGRISDNIHVVIAVL